MIIDIRDRTQWQKDGIEGSLCLPLRHVPEQLDMLQDQKNLVFVCLTGMQSRRLCYKYREQLPQARAASLGELRIKPTSFYSV